MAYIGKELILKAYKTLSDLTEDHKQGQTQIVSAIRHLIALDMYYKDNEKDCDLDYSDVRDSFTENVGKVVKVIDNYYTTNFYTTIKPLDDCGVGSNFFSAGVVNNSKQNTTYLYDYPTRGKYPLFKVKDNCLIRDVTYFRNIKRYLSTESFRCAFIIWLLRKSNLESLDSTTIRQSLSKMLTLELVDAIYPKQENLNEYIAGYELEANVCTLQVEDLLSLFSSSHLDIKWEQKIFFGNPGSGKSYKIKSDYEDRHHDRVTRTTFHPDTDYASFVGCYKPVSQGDKIKYDFVPQAFTEAYVEAWSDLNRPYYLIVEEINRGNCAQIFGDLFQLLDRNKEGYSEYPIKADYDLRDYLEEQLGENGDGIKKGNLCLPPNLSIIASMNTSDQSLFPMDSAFKRRWSWEYVPIDYNNEVSAKFEITIGGETENWHDFLKKVNEKIKKVTSSEDKQMGNFFIKQSIDEKEFCDKVMFYLWSEVGKDNYQTNDAIFKYYAGDEKEPKEFSFNELYDAEKRTAILKGFIRYIKESES